MKKVTANIVKGIIGRMRKSRSGSNEHSLGWLQKKLLKNGDDRTIKTYQFKKIKVVYKRPYELLHTYVDLFEKDLYRFTAATQIPVIFDCGANIGLSTLYFKQLYPQARVTSYEPDTNNFELLQQNCMLNGFSDVTLHQAAVWVKDGSISFDAKSSEASHIIDTEELSKNAVACVRLATLLENEPVVDFLKIDIEGAEWQVMQDCAPQLTRVQHLFLEYHGKADETYKLEGLLTLVKDAGFSVYIRNAADNIQYPFVQKTTGTIYDVQLNLFCYRN